MKKTISLVLSFILCFGFVFSVSAADDDAYTIRNPYASVNWETVSQYKTALHSHTNASDGSSTLKESIERHVETGFDIIAVTDHGTVDYSWEKGPSRNLVKSLLSVAGRSKGDIVYLGSEGTFANGVSYTYSTAENGDQYLNADGRTILKMPYGIENNAISVNAHVNSWFVDYSDNSVTIYEDAVTGVDAAGGLCVINHPGEYTKARYELRTENAYDENNPAYSYYINKFAYLIENYDALIGIDMNSKGDARTRFDRKLWDILLSRFAANGETLYAIASSDAHHLGVLDSGFTLLLMNDLTSAEARRSLESGEFFAASHCIGNLDELQDIAAALLKYYGSDNDVYKKVSATAEAMTEKIEGIENGDLKADESIGIEYSVLDSDGYTTVSTFPKVTSINVDDSENTIEINSENAMIVRFISEGKVFETKSADAAVIDLDDYAGEIGNYVRAEIFGEGGIVYTQSFTLNADENAGKSSVVKGSYFNLGFLDFLLAEFHHWFNIIVRWVSNLF
ncbi:MAG: hypothetical protein J1E34_01415 [Oscillospiraceae bacterium]|nr:hypothetical protein [Oscillospiraceae bacterium]